MIQIENLEMNFWIRIFMKGNSFRLSVNYVFVL